MRQNIRKTKEIRQFLLQNIYNKNLVAETVARFGVTRAAVYRHLKYLTEQNVIQHDNMVKGRTYRLVTTEYKLSYNIADNLSESNVFTRDIAPHLPNNENLRRVWEYGFTEMFNNAIDHSSGSKITVVLWKNILNTMMLIDDDGVGIFRNIKEKFNLVNEREALLELSKGKLTTDAAKHSGEGIFFTSRVFDKFFILSYGIMFSHNDNAKMYQDMFIEQEPTDLKGTSVFMCLSNTSDRSLKDVFDSFSGDNYGFDKTMIPIELARYGDDNLISRSQAKRVMARIELFKSVALDFTNVPYIGQAFADEIFRVFATAHPDIEILVLNANEEVSKMISRAKNVRL